MISSVAVIVSSSSLTSSPLTSMTKAVFSRDEEVDVNELLPVQLLVRRVPCRMR